MPYKLPSKASQCRIKEEGCTDVLAMYRISLCFARQIKESNKSRGKLKTTTKISKNQMLNIHKRTQVLSRVDVLDDGQRRLPFMNNRQLLSLNQGWLSHTKLMHI